MDCRFQAVEWAELRLADQITSCQLMANEALKLSRLASTLVADEYVRLAEQWLKLAMALGSEVHPGPQQQ